MADELGEHSPNPHDFATTRWSVVHAAGLRSTAESRDALAALCQAYWFPLYSFARRRTSNDSEAQDLTQAFFVELLEKNYVAAASPERGRFRAYLLTAFKHFMSKQWERANAQKRGGGRSPISLDFAAHDSDIRIEPATQLTPEQLYDRQWTLTLLRRIVDQLEAEYSKLGKARHFELLKDFMIGEHQGISYAAVAEQLGITTAAAKMAAHRMRGRYRELLRQEILQTVDSPAEVEDEIQALFQTLSTSSDN